VIYGLVRRIHLIVYVDGNIGIHATSIYPCQLFINDFNNGYYVYYMSTMMTKGPETSVKLSQRDGQQQKWEQCNVNLLYSCYIILFSRHSSVAMRVLSAVQCLLVNCMATDFRTPWASGCLLQPGYFV